MLAENRLNASLAPEESHLSLLGKEEETAEKDKRNKQNMDHQT
jgi:hypothetical protein